MSYGRGLAAAAGAVVGAFGLIALGVWAFSEPSAALNAGHCHGPDPFVAYWRTQVPRMAYASADGGERSTPAMIVSTSDRCVEAHCRKGRWDGEWTAFYRDGGASQNGLYREGLRVGTWRRFAEDGGLLGSVSLLDGSGHWIDWHPNGMKSEEGELVRGEQEGTWRSWSEDGALRSEARYARGLRDGQSTWFSEDGGLAKAEWYVYGRRADAGDPHPRFVPRLVASGDVPGCGP